MCGARRRGRPTANGSLSRRKRERAFAFSEFLLSSAVTLVVQLVDSVSTNPARSPDGAFILYSGTPRARSVPVKAVTPDGRQYGIPGAVR